MTDLAPYFEMLDELVTAETSRQTALLAELQSQLSASPGTRNALRHALALGAAGREGNDPVEGRRLLAGLRAAPGELEPAELQMLDAFQREFEARVTLYAQLARQREDLVTQAAAGSEAHARAMQVAASEIARLKRELRQAEVKLQAITELERELLEQVEQVEQVEQTERLEPTEPAEEAEQAEPAPPR